MAATTEEDAEMKRRKRLTIRLVALGFAVTAIAASPAQAKLDEGLGMPKQSEPSLVVSPDDRNVNLMSTAQTEPNVIVSPDDRKVSRMSPTTAGQLTVTTGGDGFEIGTLGMTGIVLLLGAGATLVAIQHMRRGKLASV
jgi:hypothetical protein